jgi:dihydrofolate synthase/folylpolyglutamate synthase
MIILSKDLEKRINPEKSRNFNKEFFIKNLNYLQQILNKIKLLYNYEPLKISIVGTNGKGSTGYYLSQLFYFHNFSCGFYSSPHLISFTERITINLKNFEEEELNKYYNDFIKIIIYNNYELKQYYENLTYFEVLTIFTIYLFFRFNLKVHIYEAGLGGKYDATRIVNPDIVILTNVSLDHTKVLGNTIEKILLEKLGIISEKTKILLVGDPQLKKYIEKLTLKTPILYFNSNNNFNHYLEYNKNFALFCFNSIINLLELPINIKNIELKPPMGRQTINKIKNQYYIFDVSHNTKGIYKFLIDLKNQFDDLNQNNTLIILGLLKDRSYKHIKRLFLWTKLKEFYPLPFIPNLSEFTHINHYDLKILDIKELKSLIHKKKYIIICGSFRLFEFYLNIISTIGEKNESRKA